MVNAEKYREHTIQCVHEAVLNSRTSGSRASCRDETAPTHEYDVARVPGGEMANQILEKAQESAVEIALKKLKEEFRRWYSMLSIQEIVKNQALIAEIEAMEKALLQGT